MKWRRNFGREKRNLGDEMMDYIVFILATYVGSTLQVSQPISFLNLSPLFTASPLKLTGIPGVSTSLEPKGTEKKSQQLAGRRGH